MKDLSEVMAALVTRAAVAPHGPEALGRLENPLAEGLQALTAMAEVGRANDVEAVERLEARHHTIAQRTWARVWPGVSASLAKATTPDAMDAAIEAAGNAFGDHLTAADEKALAVIVAQSYSLGQVAGIESAQERARRMMLAARSIAHSTPMPMFRIDRAITDDEAAAIFDGETSVAMTVRDRRAAAWLVKDSLFWVREVWDNDLGARIANTSRAIVLEGGRTSDVAAKLKSQLSTYDEPDSYWDVVANATVVRGRSMGSVSGFNAAGVATFRFVSVNDERTSDICKSMDGKVFTIAQANAHVDAITATDGPDEFKAVSPWVPASEVAGLSAEDLAAKGVMLPPLHGLCRSTVNVETFA